MSSLIAHGTLFAVILAITVIEAIALVLWNRRTGLGLKPVDVLFHLSAGAFILAAAWLALAGAWWGWVAAALAASGVSHLIDLRRRYKRA